MKVEVKNPNGIVVSAHVHVPTRLATSLLINTTERWVRPDSRGGTRGGGEMDQDEFAFWPADWETRGDDWQEDVVTLIAENDEDCSVLRRLAFELHDKDQLWFMYCDDSVYTEEGDKE